LAHLFTLLRSLQMPKLTFRALTTHYEDNELRRRMLLRGSPIFIRGQGYPLS
jgi:hypothetical protein